MLALAQRLVKGIESVIAAHQLPWHVVNVGARVEFVCAEKPSTNGSEARAAMNPRLEAAIAPLSRQSRHFACAVPQYDVAVSGNAGGDRLNGKLVHVLNDAVTEFLE
jgi:glutamate-1-semialdehyde aminotransferase